jgi:hypothetical protein
MGYTIDELIERLQQLRDIATAGGETWVLMQAGRHLEHIGIELQNATPTHDESEKWTVKHKHNTEQVVRVF